jgi:hypothetical protein
MKDLVTHEKTGKLKNFINERFALIVADESNGAAASAGATSRNGTA